MTKTYLYGFKAGIIYKILLLMIFSACISHAQSALDNQYGNSLYRFNFAAQQPVPGISPDAAEKRSTNRAGFVTGAVMFTGGTALSLVGHFIGRDHYDRYKKSAFTENTDRLRNQVVAFNVMRIGGGVMAGAGLLVIVLSF